MTVAEKIDYLYRKFAEPNPAQTSVFSDQIWQQGDQIPGICPVFDSNGEYKNSSGEIILKRYQYAQMQPIFGFPNAFSSDTVSDIVSHENGFDNSYEYKFYTKTNSGQYVEIPFGINSYFFDHDSGILFFPDDFSITINPQRLYITFIKYEGIKGLNTSSQSPSSPQNGPTGPTGATGLTGATGPIKDYSIKYKGTWSSSQQYSKWDLVKYANRFYLSETNTNINQPGSSGWIPFGTPQLSSGFDFPDNTFWVSPSFTATPTCFPGIYEALEAINAGSQEEATITIYPGEYEIPASIPIRSGVNINFIFKGRVRVSFFTDTTKIVFIGGSRVELVGEDFKFTNGEIHLISSNLICETGSLSTVKLYTNTTQDVSRLLLKRSEINDIENYAGFVEINETVLNNKLTIDDQSITHIYSSLFPARPLTEANQEKIEIINTILPAYGFSHPCLLIKNSRILSNEAVLYSADVPSQNYSIALLNSSLYVKDGAVSFLDFSDAYNSYVLNCLVNTDHDDTKLNILNVTDPVKFQQTDAIFDN